MVCRVQDELVALSMGWVRAALVWGLLAGAAPGEHDPGKQGLSRNLDLVRGLPCRLPQPRAVPATQLYSPAFSEVVQPAFTVLHRCEAAGCCSQTTVCAGDRFHGVTLWFQVIDLVQNSSRLHQVEALNHTLCTCQLPEDLR